MTLLNSLRKYCVVSLLAVLYATTPAVAEPHDSPENNVAREKQTEKSMPLELFAGTANEGYNGDLRSSVTAPELWSTSDISSPAYLNNRLKERITITLYRESEENRWVLESIRDGFSLNLSTDIRNLGVILEHRF